MDRATEFRHKNILITAIAALILLAGAFTVLVLLQTSSRFEDLDRQVQAYERTVQSLEERLAKLEGEVGHSERSTEDRLDAIEQGYKPTVHRLSRLERHHEHSQRRVALLLKAEFYTLCGATSQEGGRPQEAIRDLTRAIDIAPSFRAFSLRARAKQDQGDLTGAIDDLGSALWFKPNHLSTLLARAKLNSAKSGLEDALADSSRVLTSAPYSWEAWEASTLRGRLHLRAGDPKRAIEDLTRGITIAPGFELYILRAKAIRALGDEPRDTRNVRAIADLSEALKLSPGHVPSLLQRAELNYLISKFEATIADSNQLLELETGLWEAFKWRGRARVHKRLFKEGIEDYTEALETAPTESRARLLYLRGFAKWRASDYEGSIEDETLAINDTPTSGAYETRGDAKHALKKCTEAMSDYDEGLVLNPKSTTLHASRGRCLAARGLTKEALEAYKKVFDLEPSYDGWHAEEMKRFLKKHLKGSWH